MGAELLRLEHVRKAYSSAGKEGELQILKDINLTVGEGEVVSIIGKSGSGKSTLLSVAALLVSKDGGKVFYDGVDSDSIPQKAFADLRNRKMGFVFQNSLLLEDFSALENVAMPLLIRGMKKKEAYAKAEEFLGKVDLLDRKDHRPKELSGGERQRTAIARALSAEPSIIFADEPTGALDEGSSLLVENLLLEIVKEEGRGLVLVTHNKAFAEKADHMYTLRNGVLEQ